MSSQFAQIECLAAAPSADELADEWDALAPIRRRQIRDGADISYHSVVTPTVLDLLPESSTHILDVGCGTGDLSNRLCRYADRVTGIDISGESIRLATADFGSRDNITFLQRSIAEYAQASNNPHDVVVANMVMMDVADLSSFVRDTRSVMQNGGKFIFSVTHPCFWPAYSGYATAPWFDYSLELFVRAPFAISTRSTNCFSTHAHRPLEMYFESFARERLTLEQLREPMPNAAAQARYPTKWSVPRYLVGSLVAP